MGMEMRLNLKLSQQLVMTPQLQQAIKLLQLSRIELVELVREEMLENPVLEDDIELGSTNPEKEMVDSQSTAADPPVTEAAVSEPSDGGDAQETQEGPAAGEIDWENYLENYQNSAPASGGVRTSDDDLPSLEQTLTKTESLEDHLRWQLRMSDLTDAQKEIGELIIGNIDRNGYVKDSPIEDMAAEAECTIDEVEAVLMKIQGFDPVGVGARNLAECMYIQAVHYGQDDDLLVKMIRSHIGNLEKKNYQAIARDLKESLEEIYEAAKVIIEFDPRPGRQYSSDEPVYITPDVYIHKVGDKYFVVPNDDGLPKLKISNFYRSAMGGTDAKQYLQDKLRSAQWLIRSIHQRQRTIIKVTESILKFQREFFEKGVTHLKPLILRDVAEDIGMHESTISRVTTNKYLHTPQGIFELKFFFNSGITRTNGDDLASQAVKSKIKKIISDENPKKPFSDQKIVDQLKEGNIHIARRTVAKYREQLGILSSSKRKQVF
ncbi:MAG: RNA polymerase factor sigma-54 [Kofleriaceae bacterium]|nr:RNA polymerase factor sigma-54 [Kofleriaceae bacterium]